MIKTATTEKEYQKCIEYLKGKGYTLLKGTLLFYTESNIITSVAGYHIDRGAMIEPLYAENNMLFVIMASYMLGFLKGRGHTNCFVKTTNTKLKELLINKIGFIISDNPFIELYKEN